MGWFVAVERGESWLLLRWAWRWSVVLMAVGLVWGWVSGAVSWDVVLVLGVLPFAWAMPEVGKMAVVNWSAAEGEKNGA
jgi:hypothetical protein